MMEPTRANLQRTIESNDEMTSLQIFCSGHMPHPNPRMYKYYWRVFTLDSRWEGAKFFENTVPLATAECMGLLEKYRAESVPCLIYSFHRPREDSIFDKNSKKWKDISFAPSWDDDADHEWRGHK